MLEDPLQDLMATEAAAEPLHHLSVKAPTFMETSAAGWFQIMEAQFHIAKISSEETKFFHIVASLPPETITRLPATIFEQQRFSILKTAVIDLYERTKPELFEKLITSTVMTGRPSIYLQEIAPNVDNWQETAEDRETWRSLVVVARGLMTREPIE